MNISRALKEKNRFLKLLSTMKESITTGNIHRNDDVNPKVDVHALYVQYTECSSALAALKAKIAKASAGIANELAMLDQTRATLAMVREIETTGTPVAKVASTYGQASEAFSEVTVAISKAKQLLMISDLEQAMNALQDKIDDYNASTQIG